MHYAQKQLMLDHIRVGIKKKIGKEKKFQLIMNCDVVL